MVLKKVMDLKGRRIIVFILFFLNCFLAAAPLITAFSADNNHAYLLHYSGAEASDHFTEGQTGYSFSLFKKQRAGRLLYRGSQYAASAADANDRFPGHPFTSFSFPVRPAYYTLLFLYHLF